VSVALPRQARLLLDENLSPTVAVKLRKSGFDVVSVRDRRLRGKSDRHVLERAFKEDRLLVTANVADFARLAASREVHAGIALVVDGDLLVSEQEVVIRGLLDLVQDEHEAGRDLVNRVFRGGRNQAWAPDGP
jgi:predicted nuclease of predicted toxin-antitoxin system